MHCNGILTQKELSVCVWPVQYNIHVLLQSIKFERRSSRHVLNRVGMEFEGNKLTLLKRKVKHAQSGGKDEEHTSISRKTAEMQAAMDGMRKAAAGGSRVHSMREASAATTGLAASIEKEDTAHDDTPVRLAPSPTADSPRAAPAPVQSVARRAAPPMTPMHVKEAAPSWAIRWSCRECAKDCIPVRSESRCLWQGNCRYSVNPSSEYCVL